MNDVPRFSAIFDLPSCDFRGYVGLPTYSKIGRHVWTFPKPVIFLSCCSHFKQNSTGNLGNLWTTSWQPLGYLCVFFSAAYRTERLFSLVFSFFSLLLDLLAIDTGFKKGRGNRQGGGKSQFEFPARMILLKKSFVTFSSQKSRPVKRPSIPLAYRAKMVLKL